MNATTTTLHNICEIAAHKKAANETWRARPKEWASNWMNNKKRTLHRRINLKTENRLKKKIHFLANTCTLSYTFTSIPIILFNGKIVFYRFKEHSIHLVENFWPSSCSMQTHWIYLALCMHLDKVRRCVCFNSFQFCAHLKSMVRQKKMKKEKKKKNKRLPLIIERELLNF